MDIFFITGIILILSAVAVLIFRWRVVPKTISVRVPSTSWREDDKIVEEPNTARRHVLYISLSVLAFGLVWLGLSTFTVVGTRAIAVQTEFNQPTGTFDNGWHWKKPWAEVHQWDGKLQNLLFSKIDTDQEEAGPAIPVRLLNQSTAEIDTLFQVRYTSTAGVMDLFRDYRDEVTVRNNVVRKVLQSELNAVFGTFDPIGPMANAGEERVAPRTMASLAEEALKRIKVSMPAGIEAVSLTIVTPHYDKLTEDRIAAFNVATQNTAIAEQNKKTATLTKEANDLLAATNASDFEQCLAMVERIVKEGRDIGAFQCVPSAGMILPSK